MLFQAIVVDLSILVRRDHADLDRALGTLVDPHVVSGRDDIFDGLRVALIAHAVAEARVLRRRRSGLHAPAFDAMVLRRIDEHREQLRAIVALAAIKPTSAEWFTRALELRIEMLDHAARDELLGGSLFDQIPRCERRSLSADYATERLRILAIADVATLRDTPRWAEHHGAESVASRSTHAYALTADVHERSIGGFGTSVA